MKNTSLWVFVVFLIFLDQALKVFIKCNFNLGEQLVVSSWFSIYFVENNGFAFGYEFFWGWGKFFLTTIRLVFVGFIFYWIFRLLKMGVNRGVLIAVMLIFSGAIGNIIDSVFYGVFFDYAPLFFGRVVDMFYFPLFSGTYPDWLPFFGGEDFVFFRFVFNLADSYITCGGVVLLFLHKHIPAK